MGATERLVTFTLSDAFTCMEQRAKAEPDPVALCTSTASVSFDNRKLGIGCVENAID